MNAASSVHAASQLGLLPSPGWLFGSILFGLAGLAGWRYGKVTEQPRVQWLSVVLMLYPYLVSRTWLLYAIGIALCLVIWSQRSGRD